MAESFKCNPFDPVSNITSGLWSGYWVSIEESVQYSDCILAVCYPNGTGSDAGYSGPYIVVPGGSDVYAIGGSTGWLRLSATGKLSWGNDFDYVVAFIVTSFSS